MTAYQFTSASRQPLTRAEAETAAEVMLEALASNPVLHDPVIAVGPSGSRILLSIMARVNTNGADRLALCMALDAAEGEWRYALKGAECASEVHASTLQLFDRTR